MKQQYTGPYTFDLATRTITLAGVEIPQERLALIVNATVGFVYHNLEHEPTAQVTISGGDTTIVFPPYKDCETHRNTDALSIFYDDGVDLGQLIKDESDETQALLQAEFDETQTALSDFRAEVKAESDETQALLQAEFDETQAAIVSTTGGILSAVGYDAIGSFNGDYALYQGGLDKGGVINIVGGVITVVTPGSGYSAGFANSVGGTRFVVEINPSAFRMKVKAELDATQTLLQTEFDETQTAISDFRTEVKAESDETQSLLNAEFNETQTAISDFRTEVKAESDATQTLLQTEFDETQTALADFRTEVKAESDATQTLLQTEFDQTQTAVTDFRTEVKAESDETQALLNQKLAGLINEFLGVEHIVKYSAENGVKIDFTSGGYGPSQIVFSQGGATLKTLNLIYDARGNLVLITENALLWTFASSVSSAITGFRAVFTGAVNLLLGNTPAALTSNADTNHNVSSGTPTLSLSSSSVTSITCGTSSPKLGGTIDVSSFPNLTSISCAGNGITKFQGYGSLTNLVDITLNNNEFNQVGFETLSNKPGLRTLNFGALVSNQYINWTGAFPDLSAITTLVIVNINNSSLTGSNLNLSALTNLTSLSIHANLLSGAFPILPTGANSKLITINVGQNKSTRFTGTPPLLTDHPACTSLAYSNNDATGPIQDLSVRPTLTNFWCNGCLHTGDIPNLSSNTVLGVFRANGQRGTTKLTGFAGGTVSATLGDFWADSNRLSAAAVNAILAAFVAAGRVKTATNTCTLNLGGTGNAAPTGQGITDKATLQSRGWTVTTN